MNHLLLAAALAWSLGSARATEAPQRIVSLNKCADQLLVALADPSRIVSVSPIAADDYAYLADDLARLPANSGRGESILLSEADLVIAGSFDSRARRDLLELQGIPVMVLSPWDRLEVGRTQIRALAKRLGGEARGEALIAAIDTALERSRAIAPARRSVLVLHRRGYTPGDTTILDELLRHMGLDPVSERLGLPRGGSVSLERLVADPPDYLLMAEGDGEAVDQGSALLAHPALHAAVPPQRRLHLPSRLTVCDGPSTPAAIDALAREVRAKVR